ncbi:YciI family protein [Streptomyces sp. NBC_00448]|uniref:YciI family protein n=1 Tax=Streptomyces sp. NBC_00448 TaxID=2903652 RepID=UPI002E22DAA8
MRYMMLVKVDPSKAPAAGPSAEMMTEMGKLIDEMAKAGVLLDTGGLRPVEESTVLHLSGGKQTVLDGPFTEAKEIIGGYCIVQVKSREEALEWASRFLSVHDDEWELSSEIRQIVEPQ